MTLKIQFWIGIVDKLLAIIGKKKIPQLLIGGLLNSCEPAGARTQDPILKRDVLYLLSY